MSEFLLLEKDSRFLKSKPGYKGTFRAPPEVLHHQNIDSEFDRLLAWYLEQESEGELVRDLEKAKRLVQLYRIQTPPLNFQLVEITRQGSNPTVGRELLGFDLSHATSHSLLYWGLEFRSRDAQSISDESMQALLHLIEAHFQPKLNANVLFLDFATAKFCLDCMMALQTFKPGMWAGSECRFEPVGLYLIEVE